jgi:hypothetical protein
MPGTIGRASFEKFIAEKRWSSLDRVYIPSIGVKKGQSGKSASIVEATEKCAAIRRTEPQFATRCDDRNVRYRVEMTKM